MRNTNGPGGLIAFEMTKRYCTMPKVPWFRNWFEDKFGDLCARHDAEYQVIETLADKYDSDFLFACEIAKRGHFILAILALIAVSMPWVGERLKR